MRSSGSASAGGVGTCSSQKKTGKPRLMMNVVIILSSWIQSLGGEEQNVRLTVGVEIVRCRRWVAVRCGAVRCRRVTVRRLTREADTKECSSI